MVIMNSTDLNAPEIVRTIVEKHLSPAENFIYGFADLTGLVDPSFGDLTYGISIGKKLDGDIVSSIANGPTKTYYEHYKSTNRELEELSLKIARDLSRQGMRSQCVEPTISTGQLDSEYATSLRTRLSHKMAATTAGLGWIGKTALFVSRECGPRLRLVTILTNTPLQNGRDPEVRSRCGKCTLCVEACPAEAASGHAWDVSLDRDDFFDAQKCRAQCKEFGDTILGGEARICGICVSVCPVGNPEVT